MMVRTSAFFQGVRGVRIPLKHVANFIGENIHFHNYFEINAIKIPEDQ